MNLITVLFNNPGPFSESLNYEIFWFNGLFLNGNLDQLVLKGWYYFPSKSAQWYKVKRRPQYVFTVVSVSVLCVSMSSTVLHVCVWLDMCPAFLRSRKFHINCIFPQNRAAMSSAEGWKMVERAVSLYWIIVQIQMLRGMILGVNNMLDETNCRWRYHMRRIWHDTVGRVNLCEFNLIQINNHSLSDPLPVHWPR